MCVTMPCVCVYSMSVCVCPCLCLFLVKLCMCSPVDSVDPLTSVCVRMHVYTKVLRVLKDRGSLVSKRT